MREQRQFRDGGANGGANILTPRKIGWKAVRHS
jgi:hypothetical protein